MTTFSHAGVSRLNGRIKVRFANDALRVKVLAKGGHKDIDIVELKYPMTKEQAVDYLLEIRFYEQHDGSVNEEIKAALEAEQVKRSKAPKSVRGTLADSLDEIRARMKQQTDDVIAEAEEEVVEDVVAEEDTAVYNNAYGSVYSEEDLEDAPF